MLSKYRAGRSGSPSPPLTALRRVLADTAAGALIAFLSITFTLSYTALLFGVTSPEVGARGLFLMLSSSIVLSVLGALLSTLPNSFIAHDGSTVAIMSVLAASLTASPLRAAGNSLEATVVAALMLTAIFAGLLLYGLGRLRAGVVVRFIPLQVMAGLISASGWSLLLGGAAVAVGKPLALGMLANPATLLHGGTAVLVMGVMVAVTRRFRSPQVLPAIILAAVALYHAAAALLGAGLDQQREAGWLLPESRLQPSNPWSAGMLAAVDWSALFRQLPAMGAALAVVCVVVLLNASSLELSSREDVDIDQDLRANGLANLLSGLAGGMMGSLNSTRSALLSRLGTGRRVTTMLTGVAAGALPMVVPGILGLLPRPIMGALLLFVAFGLLETWFVRVRSRLTVVEWLTVVAVLLIAIRFGVPAAVSGGLALGCVTFAVIYSLGSPVRARCNGDIARSNVDRTPAESAHLSAQSGAVIVFYLQGFLFFGTASRVVREFQHEIARSGEALRFLVLDCSNIDGLDGSARATFERLQQVADKHRVSVIFAALSAPAEQRLGPVLRPGSGAVTAPTLDHALELVERDLLASFTSPPAPSVLNLLAGEAESPADAAALQTAMTASSVAEGSLLMTQGEASDQLIFLERGQATVSVAFGSGPDVRVRQFGPGAMIGEIGFLLGQPRTATVRAETACEIWTLTQASFQRLEADCPSAALALQRAVMARLSIRLLDKDQLIAALMRGSRREA